jgi:hypothetical protein
MISIFEDLPRYIMRLNLGHVLGQDWYIHSLELEQLQNVSELSHTTLNEYHGVLSPKRDHSDHTIQ